MWKRVRAYTRGEPIQAASRRMDQWTRLPGYYRGEAVPTRLTAEYNSRGDGYVYELKRNVEVRYRNYQTRTLLFTIWRKAA